MEKKASEVVSSSGQCQETVFKGTTLLCGNGLQEGRLRRNVSGGILEEVAVVPCLDCTELLTWTAWAPCPHREKSSSFYTGVPLRQCRQRGNDALGFMEEEMIKKGNSIYEVANIVLIDCFCLNEHPFLTGTVSSPFAYYYPYNYLSDQRWRETLRGGQGSTLKIQFLSFHTEACCDKLTIVDGDGTTLMSPTGGNSLPAPVISRTNVVELQFNTDAGSEYQGWNMEWFEILQKS